MKRPYGPSTADGDADYLIGEIVSAERSHFWFLARRRLVEWAVRTYFPHARSLLDVGCGTGFVLDALQRSSPPLALAGCDPLLPMLREAMSRLRDIHLFQADLQSLPVRQSFDVIAALDVLEHLNEDRQALSEIFRALRPGGGLLVTVPQHAWLWSQVDDFSRHRRRYSRADLVAKIRGAGFEVMRCTSFFSVTLPIVMLSRRGGRHRRGFDPAAELHLPRWLNAACLALLLPEWLLIKGGVSLPVGSSLMVVAIRPHA